MAEIDSKYNNSIIYIDIGNSTISLMYEELNNWQLLLRVKLEELDVITNWISKNQDKYKRFAISSVRSTILKKLKLAIPSEKLIILTVESLNSDKIDYLTPKTLGIDRVLGCLAAHKKSGSKNVIVIDSGSACTIDFMDFNGVYKGGIIIPGLKPFLDIFKLKAPELPTVPYQLPDDWPGKNTVTSLQWGQLGFYLDGITSAIKKFEQKYGNAEVYLTGGDAKFLYNYLKSTVFYEEFLIVEGMKILYKEVNPG